MRVYWSPCGPQGEDIMRRFRLLIAFPAAVALAVSVAVSAGPVVSAQAAPAELQVITTFTPNHLPESLAIDGQGNLYASLDFIGEVVKVTPSGQQQPVASLDVGTGFLTGLAFDPSGNLYVADATFEASPTPPGVFRIGAGGGVTRVATLPADSFPNGLAFHDGYLYISDSSLGAIWRLPPGGNAAIWLQDPLLAPKTKTSIGANDEAFLRDSLYVSVSDSGTIVRVPLTTGGNAGIPVVVAQAPLLRTADGIAFDINGNLYVAAVTSRRALERSAATATDKASFGSFLLVSPASSNRTRAASLGGTSSTRSPTATSCWASRCPSPAAPSTAQIRSGQAAAHVTSRSAWVAEARTRNSPSGSSAAPIATAVCEPLCGSTPIITVATGWSLHPRPGVSDRGGHA